MLDHVSINVSDLARSKTFYEQTFASIGYAVSFGEDGDMWAFDITDGLFEIIQSKNGGAVTPVHVAFRVANKEQVHAFYEAAMAAGGKDNGAPGPCPEYTLNYYACFVFDPDGNNIEAMVD